VISAFEKLGLPIGLIFSEEEIREAFRKSAALAHPDSGGDEKNFSEIQIAQDTLMIPSRRLKEWLAGNGHTTESRGQIESGLMDLFQRVAEVGSAAEAAIKSHTKAQSALARGMAEVAMMSAREKVSEVLVVIEKQIQERMARFPEIEKSGDFLTAETTMRDLVFLEKWRGTLKSLFGRLI
jgi:curved DNA-binding protein CbpA